MNSEFDYLISSLIENKEKITDASASSSTLAASKESEIQKLEFIYVISEQETTNSPYIMSKIGKTVNVENKLKNLQNNYPRTLQITKVLPTYDSPKHELECHKKLKNYHLSDNWYNLPISLHKEIATDKWWEVNLNINYHENKIYNLYLSLEKSVNEVQLLSKKITEEFEKFKKLIFIKPNESSLETKNDEILIDINIYQKEIEKYFPHIDFNKIINLLGRFTESEFLKLTSSIKSGETIIKNNSIYIPNIVFKQISPKKYLKIVKELNLQQKTVRRNKNRVIKCYVY